MEMTARRREMYGLVERYERSGAKRDEFCERHGVRRSTFSWWVSEYRRRQRDGEIAQAQPSFVPVAGPAVGQSVEYRFADGASVRIPASIGAAQIASIVRELHGVPCSA